MKTKRMLNRTTISLAVLGVTAPSAYAYTAFTAGTDGANERLAGDQHYCRCAGVRVKNPELFPSRAIGERKTAAARRPTSISGGVRRPTATPELPARGRAFNAPTQRDADGLLLTMPGPGGLKFMARGTGIAGTYAGKDPARTPPGQPTTRRLRIV
ncbi:hypothetical protein ACTMU2_16875 [Cupriavidus basilensis]